MDAPTSPYESLRRELLSIAPDAAKKSIADYLLQVSAEIMRLSPTRHQEIKAIYLDRSLNQLGLDSLTAVAFRVRIKADLLVSVPFERFSDTRQCVFVGKRFSAFFSLKFTAQPLNIFCSLKKALIQIFCNPHVDVFRRK